jgi:hypothetical protein
MKFSHTLKTSASAAKIWQIWTDVERWSEWDTELYSARLNDCFELGAVGKLTPKRGSVARFKISQFSRGESYTFTIKLPLCRLNVHRYLTDRADGLYFTHEVAFQGILAVIFGLLLGRKFKAVLPSVMQNVKQIAESEYEYSAKS